MNLTTQEIQFTIQAVDLKQTTSTQEAVIKGSMLIKLARFLDQVQNPAPPADSEKKTDNKKVKKPAAKKRPAPKKKS